MKSFDIKNRRPFVGIILKINGINYFAPLSSPKEKHLNMKNNIDFIKINKGRDGVINLNNMIPIPEEQCYEINIKEENDIDSLFRAGGTTMLKNDIKGLEDFELITFMVVV